MINLDSYRTALLAVFIGVLTGVSAQAQTTASAPAGATNGSAVFAANTSVANDATVLQLSQPPAPEVLAHFYDGSQKDLHQSLAWIQETNTVAPTYWTLYTEARIRLQLLDYAGAHAAAEQAYKLALKAMPVSQDYVALSAAVVTKAQQLASR
jgi:hypothetical protein